MGERAHLWPEALMDTTFFRRKSHLRSGYRKGTTKAPEAPSMWILMSQPFLSFSLPAEPQYGSVLWNFLQQYTSLQIILPKICPEGGAGGGRHMKCESLTYRLKA